MQGRGTKTSSGPYKLGVGNTPPYEPQQNTEIEKHCADFLEFSHNRCHLPDAYWLSTTTRTNQGLALHMQEGDFRITVALTVIRAMFGKAWCSFIPPREDERTRSDTYYFPQGVAFTNEGKASTIAAASILVGNPNAVLPLVCLTKGHKWNTKLNMLCDVQQPAGFVTGVEPMAKAKAKAKSTSSSSTKPDEPEVKKRPAARR